MKKYYFVIVEFNVWTRHIETNVTYPVETNKERQLIDMHPLAWEFECNKEHSQVINNLVEYNYQYRVQSWQEITEEEYLTFKDNF